MAQGSVKPHIAKDGTKTWRWRLAVADPATGKRRWSQWTFRTKRELETFKAQKLTEVAQGQTVHRSTKTVGQLLTEWLTLEAPHSGLAITSQEKYELMVRRHLIPALGTVPIQKLTTEAVERHYASLLDAGYARATVNLAHVCLRQALDRAVRHKLLSANVAAVRMKVLSTRNREARARREMHTWTREECDTFLAVAPDSKHGPLWPLLLATGLRRGEALGLRWQDLTLPSGGAIGQLRVYQSVEPLAAGPPLIMEPKTKEPRAVPLVPTVVSAMVAYRADYQQKQEAAGAAWQPQYDLIFCRRDGAPLDPNHIMHDLDRLVVQASVPRLTVHELRHTFATLCLEAAVPIHVVSRWLGHASVTVTMNVYAHITQRMEDHGAEVLVGLFSGAKTASEIPSVHLPCASCPFVSQELALHQR